jgi:hypothetical protein
MQQLDFWEGSGHCPLCILKNYVFLSASSIPGKEIKI